MNVNARKFLLTYPKCTLSKEEVLAKLQALYEISEYTVCEEKHSDGTPHVHAVIRLSKRLHSMSPRCFDLGVWHPNIKVLKTQKDFNQAGTYVRKDGSFISNVQETLGKRAALAQVLVEAGQITKKLILENPEILFLNHSSICSWLRYLKKPVEVVPPTLKRRHIWLSGPSDSGKTYWLRIYLSLSQAPCEIPANNDFRDADLDTDCLYFDEYKGCLTVQQLNRLCDGDTQVNTKGGSTRIGFPTVVIVSNYTIRDCYPKIEDKIYDTLRNRFIEYDSSYKLPKFPYSIINN